MELPQTPTFFRLLGRHWAWPVIGKDGSIYASRLGTGGNFNTGEVVQLNPTTGAITRTLATGLTCPNSLVVDPLSGDLFFDEKCNSGANDPNVYRISNPGSSESHAFSLRYAAFVAKRPDGLRSQRYALRGEPTTW